MQIGIHGMVFFFVTGIYSEGNYQICTQSAHWSLTHRSAVGANPNGALFWRLVQLFPTNPKLKASIFIEIPVFVCELVCTLPFSEVWLLASRKFACEALKGGQSSLNENPLKILWSTTGSCHMDELESED